MPKSHSLVTKFGRLQFQVAFAASTIRILTRPTETLLASDVLHAELSPAASTSKHNAFVLVGTQE